MGDLKDRKSYFNAQKCELRKVQILLACFIKQILKQKRINIDTQFLGTAEGSFQVGRSRISNNIYDMKTTLILKPEYKSYDQRQIFWEIFATFNFVAVLLAAKVKRKIESDIGFSGRRDEVTAACLLAKQ